MYPAFSLYEGFGAMRDVWQERLSKKAQGFGAMRDAWQAESPGTGLICAKEPTRPDPKTEKSKRDVTNRTFRGKNTKNEKRNKTEKIRP